MDIIINGYLGHMGQVLEEVIDEDPELRLVARVDRTKGKTRDGEEIYGNLSELDTRADLIIDFSHPNSLRSLIAYGLDHKIGLVIGTTGYSQEELELIKEASRKIPIFHSSNMSLGINVLLDLVKEATRVLDNFDIEIIEKHHNKKLDAPSGTAFMIAEKVRESAREEKDFIYGRSPESKKRQEREVAIHAIRAGSIVGEHSILYAGQSEVLEIKHTAQSKRVFAEGALKAGYFLLDKEAGLYNMDDLIK